MLQHKADLLQLHTGETLHEFGFGHGDPVFQVLKQGSHRDPGAANLVPRTIQARFACPGLLVEGCCFSALAAYERKLTRVYF